MKWMNQLVFGFLVFIIVMSGCVFTVYQPDRAIVTRLGDLLLKNNQVVVYSPGLHFKLPFVDSVRVFDARLNLTEIPAERTVTREKEVLLVNLFIQWRIEDYARYYNATQAAGDGSRDRAEQLLRQNVKGILHAEFGQRTLQNVVSGERGELMEKLRVRANKDVEDYGMEVIDVRINRVEYPQEVNDKVFARMSSERKRVAVAYRASGESKAAIIRAEADMRAKVLIAEAQKEGVVLRGEGDAMAAEISAKAFSQSPDFYRFYQSLETYRKSFDTQNDILVLKPDGDLFKYFKQYQTKE